MQSTPPTHLINEDGRETHDQVEIAHILLTKMLEPNLSYPTPTNITDSSMITTAIQETQREKYNEPICQGEAEEAYKELRNSAPGPDLVHHLMLKNLTTTNKKFLTHLLNSSLRAGSLPQAWKEAIVVPMLKQGKQKHRPDSYRPIALTSALCKLMGKLSQRE